MTAREETAYIVYDTESVVDGALLSRVLYPELGLTPEEAVRRYREEKAAGGDVDGVFIPVTFQVPVAVAVARVRADFRLADVACLDAPRFEPRSMVGLFWRGIDAYRDAVLVDFNGRCFDIPLLSLSAFRFGIACGAYFDDGRYGFRYRFTEKHLDLLEWLTEYGAYRMTGGLNLLAKLLGKPGKMETCGKEVSRLYLEGRVQEINDYCLHDVLDTYFVFLRTRVLAGKITIEEEQTIVEETKGWLEERAEKLPCLSKYLECFGRWNPEPFA